MAFFDSVNLDADGGSNTEPFGDPFGLPDPAVWNPGPGGSAGQLPAFIVNGTPVGLTDQDYFDIFGVFPGAGVVQTWTDPNLIGGGGDWSGGGVTSVPPTPPQTGIVNVGGVTGDMGTNPFGTVIGSGNQTIPVNNDPSIIGSPASSIASGASQQPPGTILDPYGSGQYITPLGTNTGQGFPTVIPLPVDNTTALILTGAGALLGGGGSGIFGGGGGGGSGVMGPQAPNQGGSTTPPLILSGGGPQPTNQPSTTPPLVLGGVSPQPETQSPSNLVLGGVSPQPETQRPSDIILGPATPQTTPPTTQTPPPETPSMRPPVVVPTTPPATQTPPPETPSMRPPIVVSTEPPTTKPPTTNISDTTTAKPPTVISNLPNIPPGTTGKPETVTPPMVVPINPPVTTPPVVTTPPTSPPPQTPPTTIPTNPFMPTASVLDRNYFREGMQGVTDYKGGLGQGMSDIYNQFASQYGQSDLDRYIAMQRQLGQANAANTQLASQQTSAANTALRSGNISDVESFGPRSASLYRSTNPELYQGLSNYSGIANQQLAADQAAVARGGQLTPEEIRNAQQAAREGWAARGLVNSTGAVAEEVLNRQNAIQAREQQARANMNQSMSNAYSGLGAQTANKIDPFAMTLGSQYGMQTGNAGTNAALYGQGTAFSSGQQGNQYVQNAFNPFNTYSNDVYGSNFNAANARAISDANNAAAIATGRDTANATLAKSFFDTLFNVGKNNNWWCWVAREIYGVDNPKWLLFRHWMLNVGPKWFRKLYIKHGEAFAAWLHVNPWLKPAIRAFMDSRIESLQKQEFSHAV